MDSNTKVSIGLVIALVTQTGAGGYWLSQQVSAINANTEFRKSTVEELKTLKGEIDISPTYEDTDALFASITGIANKLEAVVDALEDVFKDEHGIEFEIEQDDFWDD
jgi:hypothetical protein